MKLSKEGMILYINGHWITRSWPWAKNPGKYFSSRYGQYFSSLPEFWMFVGKIGETTRHNGDRVEGFETLTVLTEWVELKFGSSPVVIMTDINVSVKSMAFWTKISKERIQQMSKEVVVLRCSSKAEVLELTTSITSEFANAAGFANGELVATN